MRPGGIRVEGNAVGAALISGQGNIVTIVYGAGALRERPRPPEHANAARRMLGPNPVLSGLVPTGMFGWLRHRW